MEAIEDNLSVLPVNNDVEISSKDGKRRGKVCGESAPAGGDPTFVKVDCDASLIPATTSIFVGGQMVEASVCARGLSVHSGMKCTNLIHSYST